MSEVGHISVRPATNEDAAAIQMIAEMSGLNAWTVSQYAEEIGSKRAVVLVCVDDDNIAGFVLGRVVPGSTAAPVGEIYNIAVTDLIRRKGIGRKLLIRALEFFKSAGCQSVWLEVRSTNLHAVQFYESNGFKRSALRKNFYSNPVDDALVMQLVLVD